MEKLPSGGKSIRPEEVNKLRNGRIFRKSFIVNGGLNAIIGLKPVTQIYSKLTYNCWRLGIE